MLINQKMKERREAYVEVLEVLKHMDKKYVSKIPLELREFFERNASKDYKFNINSEENYTFKENTINILAMLNINYWCESEEHKQKLLRKYYENDLKKEKQLREKYNTDNLFKRETEYTSLEENGNVYSMPVKYEENKWYKKAYNKIVLFIEKIFKFNKM